MKIIFKYICLCICVLAFVGQVFAQNTIITITGKVTDKDDKLPITGASVTILDKDNRVVGGSNTDIEGNYAVRIKDKTSKLVVSFIGYKSSKAQVIGDRTRINVILESDMNILNEVVIKAEATVDDGGGMPISRARSTAAISSINAKELEEMSSASIDQALQGRLAGVDIGTTSGDPGAGMQIRIRGTSSLNGANDPLIVVDGMPYEITVPDDFNFATSDDNAYGQLLNIAPTDIKEISVLKDAAATAIWGSRGANGVLLITTKRGNPGPPNISYNFRGSVSQQPKAIPLLNGDQYTTLLSESFYNAGRLFSLSENAKQFQYDPNDTYTYYNFSNNTDWVSAITQTGYLQDHNIQINGGGEKARYLTSIGYFNQQGVTKGTSLDRLSARVNLDYVVSSRLRFQSDIAYTHVDNEQLYFGNVRDIAYSKMPNQSVYEYDEYGNLTGNLFVPVSTAQGYFHLKEDGKLGSNATFNPLAMTNYALNNQLGDNLTSRFNINYQLIPKILRLDANVAVGINNNKTKIFLPQSATGRPSTETTVNRAGDSDLDQFNMTTKTSLLYTPNLGDKHLFTGNLTLTTYDGSYTIQGLISSNSASSYLQDPSIPSRTNLSRSAYSTVTQSRNIGVLTQFNYAYLNRYIFAASVRMDGNSKFGTANRYAYFPAISGAWRVGEEDFVKDVKFISDIKLRASYGKSGNAPRGDYGYFNIYNSYGFNYLGETGVYSSNLELSDYKWETISSSNLGLDIELFDHRLRLGGELYKKRTSDLMMSGIQVASYNGFSSLTMNVGTMDNDGWEADVRYTAVRNKKWVVDLNFNIAHNQNVIREISRLYARESTKNMLANKNFYTFLQEDNPFGSFYGYKFLGVYKDKESTIAKDRSGNPIISPDGEEVYMRFGYPTIDYTFQPGDAMYEDINHDGVINEKDVVYLGNSNPKLTGGFGTSVTYKSRLKFSAFFTLRQGIDMINGTKMNTTDMSSFNNQSTGVLRRWRNEGDVTDIPRAFFGTNFNSLGSSRYVEDASFLRLRTVTVRYDFAKKLTDRLKLKSLSAYVTAENLFTITNYTGQDPDVAVRLNNAFSTLVDYSMTPPLKNILFGISTRF